MGSRKAITIGADPEFVIVRKDTKEFVYAAEVLPCSTSAQLGTDGASSTGEMRPTPNKKWQEVYADIELLINELRERIGEDEFEVIAGSGYYVPTGGHIHIGDRFRTHAPTRNQLDNWERWITIPLNEVSDRSYRGRYGTPREIRYQEHGFEYRSPLSWIVTPTICKGVLCLAHVIGRQPHDQYRTKEALFKAAGQKEQVIINEYLNALEELRVSNKKLEQIDLFQAWEKPTKVTKYAPVFNTGDYKMFDIANEIGRTKFDVKLFIYGKANYEELAIYLPPWYESKVPDMIDDIKIKFWRWEQYNGSQELGLSRKLREEKTPKYIKSIIKKVAKIMKEARAS